MIKYKIRGPDWLTFPLITVNFNNFFIQPAPELIIALKEIIIHIIALMNYDEDHNSYNYTIRIIALMNIRAYGSKALQ